MSIFIQTSLDCHHTWSCPAMPRLSSHLHPRRQLKKVTALSTVPVTVFFLALFVSSCEGRRLVALGPKASSSSEQPPEPSPCKADGSSTNQIRDLSIADARVDRVDVKVEGVTMTSSGAVRTMSRMPLSERELQREDTAFHLDYDGPMTHTPVHN